MYWGLSLARLDVQQGALADFVEGRSGQIHQAGQLDDAVSAIGEGSVAVDVLNDEGVATELEPSDAMGATEIAP